MNTLLYGVGNDGLNSPVHPDHCTQDELANPFIYILYRNINASSRKEQYNLIKYAF